MRNARATSPDKTASGSYLTSSNRITYTLRSFSCRIGISGWRYPGWRKKFYPSDLPQRRELEHASRVFNSIEINGSFYSLQLPSSYQRWCAETPDDFIFSVKGPRYITHMKQLREVTVPL